MSVFTCWVSPTFFSFLWWFTLCFCLVVKVRCGYESGLCPQLRDSGSRAQKMWGPVLDLFMFFQVINLILQRSNKLCNVIEWQDTRLVYKRYASLYFAICIDPTDNELLALEQIHLYVETLDRYFGNVCELDLIFNFHKACTLTMF